MQYGFFFDQSRCYDCKSCAVACKDWNDIEPGPIKWLRMFSWEEGTFPEVSLKALFAPCYHCEQPACVGSCPESAIFKEDNYGAVLVDQDRCSGCKACYDACEYGAPQFSQEPDSKMSKCTMCIDRLETGLQPICVLSCPLRALDFGPLDEMIEKYGDLRELAQMPSASTSHPAAVFKAQAERKTLVTLDPERTRAIMGTRGDLPALYAGTGSSAKYVDGLVGRDNLNMKPQSPDELMYLTRNDEG